MKQIFGRPRLIILIIAACAAWTLALGGTQLRAGSNDAYKELKLFSDVLQMVQRDYVDEVENEKLIEGALQGMVHSLDPHSAFLPPEAFEELQVDTHGEFGGLGIIVGMRDDILTVIAPLEGTPADRAGLQPGDMILKVDGETTRDMKLWESIKKLRGKKGTSVTITIWREGLTETEDVTLVRDVIPIESIRHLTLKPGYGYVRITNFRDHTTRDLRRALAELESQETPLKGLVLDMRNNPGGLLEQAVEVSDLFLDKGEIVSLKGRKSRHNASYKARKNRPARDYPMVVLINAGSASASEIVAGALKDNGRAVIVGTKSYGKGSVQTVENLQGGYGLKLTVARYYTPSGITIQDVGIEPDIVLEREFEKEKEDNGKLTDKEKILENVWGDGEEELEPEGNGGGSTKPKKTPKDPEKLTDEEKAERYKLPTAEKLMKDNQIRYSLELLIGFNVLNAGK